MSIPMPGNWGDGTDAGIANDVDPLASDPLQTVTPMMADAVDRQVLMVPPDQRLSHAIAAMGAVWSDCGLASKGSNGRHSSCALVVEDGEVTGIFTERDIVRLTANGVAIEALTVADVMTSPVKTLQESAFQDIFAVLFLFRRYRIRHLPIVDDQNHPIGIVTPNSIRGVLRPANLLRMRRVADVMSTHVIHATPTTPVLELAQKMAAHRVSCIVIVETDSQATAHRELRSLTPMGIVTERDIVQFQALELNLQRLTAQDVMSSPLFLLEPNDSLWTAHQEMKNRRVRRLVVSWNWGSDLGIVTQTSLLKVFDPIEMYGIIESMQQTLEQISPGGSSETAKKTAQKSDQVTDLLFDIEARLLSLDDGTTLVSADQKTIIHGALRSLQQVQSMLL